MRLVAIALLFTATTAGTEDLKAVIDQQAATLSKDRPYLAAVIVVVVGKDEIVVPVGLSDGKAPDRDSVFEIGSITKTFTGLLLADRVAAGIVKLDDPIQKHLPTGWVMPRRDERDISLIQLATHTSGLAALPNGFIIRVLVEPKNPYAKYTPAMLCKALPKTPINHPIGARHEYSNLGVGLLGHALAHASKVDSYEHLLSDRVLKPLVMTDTGFALTDGMKKRLIPGFTAKGESTPTWEFGCLEACGGLRSTAADMVKYVRANLDPPEALKAAVAMTHQPWRELVAKQSEVGLCWMRRVLPSNRFAVWHNGQTGGYHSFVGVVRGKGGIAVLCNVATGKVDEVGFTLLERLAGEK